MLRFRSQKQKEYLCFLALDTFWTLPTTGKVLIDNTLAGYLQYTSCINITVYIISNFIKVRCRIHTYMYLYTFWMSDLSAFGAFHERLDGLKVFRLLIAFLTYGTYCSKR